jgi:hypothetical protein
VEVAATTYSRVLGLYSTQVGRGTITATPYSLPKVPGVVGTKLSGAIFQGANKGTGTMVLLPMRDKTLEIWTESNDYLNDFDTYVLPNMSFSP